MMEDEWLGMQEARSSEENTKLEVSYETQG